MKISQHWKVFWFKGHANERENLGLFRIIFYLLCMIIFFVSFKIHTLFVDEAYYEPVFFYSFIDSFHQSQDLYFFAKVAFYAFSFLSLVGFLTPIVTKLAFLSAFYLFAPFQNYGSYQHLGSTIIIGMLIVSLSACGDAYSVDSYLRKRNNIPLKELPSGGYTWPLTMLKFVWCFIFFSAGILKLATGGWDWLRFNMLGIFLERLDFLYAFNTPNPLSVGIRKIIQENYWIGRIATIGAVLLELAMPVMYYGKKSLYVILILTIAFLLGIMVVMGHHFYYTLLPYLLGIIFLEFNVVDYLSSIFKKDQLEIK